MPLAFEYDPRKAARNLKKHGVSFTEATTVFNDPFAQTFPDDLHSHDEERWITLGVSSLGSGSSSYRISRPTASSASSVHATRRHKNKMTTRNSKPARKPDPLTPRPLDLSKAVRGKYYDRMQEGSNLVLIAPDLIDAFPDSESVNEALRSLKTIAARTRKAS